MAIYFALKSAKEATLADVDTQGAARANVREGDFERAGGLLDLRGFHGGAGDVLFFVGRCGRPGHVLLPPRASNYLMGWERDRRYKRRRKSKRILLKLSCASLNKVMGDNTAGAHGLPLGSFSLFAATGCKRT